MALSYVRSTASGSTDTFSIPFPYLDRAHVVVTLDGVATTAFTWPTNGSIKLTAGNPAAGVVVERRRVTPTTPLVVFTPGALEHEDLNTASLQAIYLAQEANDLSGDLDSRAWLTNDYRAGGTIEKGAGSTVPKFDPDGNLIPGPTVAEIAAAEGWAEQAKTYAEEAAVYGKTLWDSDVVVQKRLMELITGFDPGTDTEGVPYGPDTSIFAGAGFTANGLWIAKIDGVWNAFLTVRCVVDDYGTGERCRIVRFIATFDGSAITHVEYSEKMNLGHGQVLSGRRVGNTTLLYTWMPTEEGFTGNSAGKGYSEITWRGAATSQSDVVSKQCMAYPGAGNRSQYRHCDWTVDPTGKYLVANCYKDVPGADSFVSQTVMVFDFAEMNSKTSTAQRLAVEPICEWQRRAPMVDRGMYKQGITVNSKGRIAIISGFNNVHVPDTIEFWDLYGNFKKAFTPTGPRAEYGRAAILDHPTLGFNVQMEPESVTWVDDNTLAWLTCDQWRLGSDVVTDTTPSGVTGTKWARIGPTGTQGVTFVDVWAATNKAANRGAWVADPTNGGANPELAYTIGRQVTKRSKTVYALVVPKGEVGELALDAGFPSAWSRQPASLLNYEMSPNITFKADSSFNGAAYAYAINEYMQAFAYLYARGSQSSWRVYDLWSQVGDGFQMFYRNSGGRHIGGVSFGSGLGSINWYGTEDSSTPGEVIIRNRGGGGWRIRTGTTGALVPWLADTDLGESATRLARAFVNSTIGAARVVTAAGSITMTASDNLVVVNKSTGAATAVTLPASPIAGQSVVVKDGKGDANTNNITVTPAAGNVDGAANKVINTAYGVLRLTYSGTQWLTT